MGAYLIMMGQLRISFTAESAYLRDVVCSNNHVMMAHSTILVQQQDQCTAIMVIFRMIAQDVDANQDKYAAQTERVQHHLRLVVMEQCLVCVQQQNQNIVTMEIYKMIVHDADVKQDKHVPQTEHVLFLSKPAVTARHMILVL